MRSKALESKVIKYPTDLCREEMQTHREACKQNDRKEMLSRNSGRVLPRRKSPPVQRGFSIPTLPSALFNASFCSFIEMLIK
jgi:hypothetical protein